MEIIKLINIQKKEHTLEYEFTTTEGLRKYFSGKPFRIEYTFSVESIPNSIAAVPFVCNVLPIIWLTNSVLELNELDKAFYDSIPQFKQGYVEMFPECNFLGIISVKSLVECDIPSTEKSATFFSGGLDAVNTLVMHLDEKPALISIWGSDIKYENASGWKVVHDEISKTAKLYNLNDIVIRSTFREFDNEYELENTIKINWWHDLKHGIGLLGHAAPYVYEQGISKLYIASSNCPLDKDIKCASHPTIDNHVRFAHTKVVHDGYEYSRQDKAHNVVEYSKKSGEKVSLHVCWKTQTGNNCCKCEKCYRTMLGIISEGADPVDFGFFEAPTYIPNCRQFLIGKRNLETSIAKRHWTHIHNAFVNNLKVIKKTPYWKHVKWIYKSDFSHPETLNMPPKSLREWLSRQKFYQKLHDIKINMKKS
ncbi:MAG: hypothetical protein J6Q89_09435 [Clostridia bacterium]|nr:hypothetical protein [Clostridia bacterium]